MNLFTRLRESAACSLAWTLSVAALFWLVAWDARALDDGEYECAGRAGGD